MNARVKGAALAAVVIGTVVLRRLLGRSPSGWSGSGAVDPQRWRVVTVNRSHREVGDNLPEPLAKLGEAVEVRVSAAPGDKGTEIAVRLKATGDGDPSLEDVRRALREAKQILEVGWVLEPNRNTTTRSTLLNAALRRVTEHARRVGRL
jgi:hypothetical protein